MSSAETSAAPVFLLEGVTYRYPDGEIGVHDLDLSIREQERIVLLGANGSANRRFSRFLDGLIFPGDGVVHAFGRPLNEKSLNEDRFNHGFRRRVGFVFQNSETQLFSPTVWDEIAFGPLHMGMSELEIRRRVSEVLELFGIEVIRDRPPFKLSGEKKKVALAAVMATNPDVLLLDEPTAALDPRTQRWLTDMLIQLGKFGKTLITSTHHLDIVEEISDRVLIFGEDHRVAASGPASELLSEKELLLRVNLIDPRFHKHPHDGDHRHYHIHD